MQRSEIKALWKQHGGSQHGPHVEHMLMPESKFWGFCDSLLNAARAQGREAPDARFLTVGDGMALQADRLLRARAAGLMGDAVAAHAAMVLAREVSAWRQLRESDVARSALKDTSHA